MTDDHKAILAFERQWWQLAGNKETAIREQFGISAVRFYQRLNAVLDQPEALAFDPQLVRRLQRIRSQREKTRMS